jgi:ABC-type nitrate/sulfonate/bicarbonate transport system substrate-binding protein
MAILAETPLVLSSFERSDLKILAALRSVDNLAQIVGRADKGIRSTTDLKGRRVGITKGTAPHYFLDLELVGQGLSEKQITPVFLKSDKLISSLSGGKVDAIAVTNTMAYKARQKLGDRAIILQNPGLCRNYSLLVTMQGYAKNQHERINSFLKALHEAEQFKKLSPAKSQELIIAALKISEIEYSAVLKSFDDRLTLDNGLIMTLEEHARWVIEKKMVNAPRIPNYLNTIEATHLQKISPDSVRLKR